MQRTWHLAEGYAETAWAFVWLCLIYVFVPPAPLVPDFSDATWQAWLTEAFLRRLSFGTSVVFTYGPWGFLAEPRGSLEILPWLRVGRLVLAAGTSVGAGILFARLIERPVLRYVTLTAFLTLANPILILPVLLALAVFDFRLGLPRTLAFFLIPSCALASHVKFTSLWLLAVLAILLLAKEVALDRRFPWQALTLAVCYAAWFLAAGQSLAGLPSYLRAASLISGGYEGAMALAGPASFPVLGLLLVFLVCWMAFANMLRSRSWSYAAGSAWLAFALFAGFKMTFVRNEADHYWLGMGEFLLPVALVISLLPGARLHIVLRAAVATLAAVLTVVPYQCQILRLAARRAWTPLTLLSSDVPLRVAETRAKEEVRRRFPLPNLSNSVDLAPLGHCIGLAYDWNLKVRPVPVSYGTYSSRLASLNEHFFRSPDAPEYLVLALRPIDNHYPTLEDSLAWRTWLARYQPVRATPDFVILERRPRDLQVRVDEPHEIRAAFGQQMELPKAYARELVWARIRISSPFPLSILGRIWRPEILRLEVRSELGTRTYRFIPGAAESGFLLSPLVDSLDSMASLFPGGDSQAPPADVRSIALHRTEAFPATYSSTYSLSFERMVLTRDGEPVSPPQPGTGDRTSATRVGASDTSRP